MPPLYEYFCTDPKCERFEQIIEELSTFNEVLDCSVCSTQLTRLTSASNGYVTGPDAMSNKVNRGNGKLR